MRVRKHRAARWLTAFNKNKATYAKYKHYCDWTSIMDELQTKLDLDKSYSYKEIWKLVHHHIDASVPIYLVVFKDRILRFCRKQVLLLANELAKN